MIKNVLDLVETLGTSLKQFFEGLLLKLCLSLNEIFRKDVNIGRRLHMILCLELVDINPDILASLKT